MNTYAARSVQKYIRKPVRFFRILFCSLILTSRLNGEKELNYIRLLFLLKKKKNCMLRQKILREREKYRYPHYPGKTPDILRL